MREQSQRISMLEELSEHLLRCGLTDTWRSIFVEQKADAVQFRTEPFTLLCSDNPGKGVDDPVIAVIAERYRGCVQYGSRLAVALSFEVPSAALRAALALQRLAGGRRLRTAIASGSHTAATVDIAGERRQFLLGDALAQAERDALAAPPGTIQMSPGTYRLVQAEIATTAPSAMVMTEMHGDELSSASLTLPPSRCSDSSTFAGLGLV